MRSFSNLWFWIALAVVWSSASHWVLGVPYDLIQRASRHGGQAQTDLEDIVRINVNRILHIGRVSGLWLLGIVSFFLTMLGLLAFYYDIETAQAIFLIAFPMSIVGALSLSTARLIETEQPDGSKLIKRLHRHRLWTQFIGMASIIATVFYWTFRYLAATPGF